MNPKILIIGATGFVGKNLLKEFQKDGKVVRVLVRSPQKLAKSSSNLEIFKGDLLDRASLQKAFVGIETIYYLAHALDKAHDFEDIETFQAKNCQEIADAASIKKIIYLGALSNDSKSSKHIRSRIEVGNLLSCGKTPVIELRASVVLGFGSFPFEMIKALVERLPFITAPNFGMELSQPLNLPSLMSALSKAQDFRHSEHHTIIEIGDDFISTYSELLKLYADTRGLIRPTLKSSSITVSAAQKILDWVIPEYAVIGKKLLESMSVSSVVKSKKHWDDLGFEPINFKEYMNKLVIKEQDEIWSEHWDQLLDNPSLKEILKFSQIYYQFEFPIQEKEIISPLYKQLKKVKKVSDLLSINKSKSLSVPTLLGGDIDIKVKYDDGKIQGALLLTPGKFLDKISIVIFKQFIQKIYDMKKTKT